MNKEGFPGDWIPGKPFYMEETDARFCALPDKTRKVPDESGIVPVKKGKVPDETLIPLVKNEKLHEEYFVSRCLQDQAERKMFVNSESKI